MEKTIKKLSVYQKPKVRNQDTRVRILMYGRPEVGKSYLSRIITRNLDTFKVDGKRLFGAYNHFLYDGAENYDAIIIDDVPVKSGKQNFNFLKGILKNPTFQINRLNKPLINLSYQSIIVITNVNPEELFKGENIDDFFDLVMPFFSKNDFYDYCQYAQIPLKFL